jgi:GDP/UDP-N,N'-diacetylbacillosamine 2-epimerase (hydrolysing)
MKGLLKHESFKLSICVTGMHLSPEFNLTFKNIIDDGFYIDEKVEILLSSDSSVGISKSIGLGVISFSEVFDRIKPDLVFVLGDRFEIFSACTAAMISNIPIAHCHGGEATEGLIDEAIRHSITKMSHIHFTSTNDYKKRVEQMGEDPSKVFNVGALGIENINKLKLFGKEDFEKKINLKLRKIVILITFHPVTLEKSSSKKQFCQLIQAIDKLENSTIIFTKPNADMDGRIISELIDSFVTKNPKKSISYVSMGQKLYLSAIKHSDIVIGNSSSGLIEVPSFKKATINIGDRQKGRIKGPSVIDCDPIESSITKSINIALSEKFSAKLKSASNPYGFENSSNKILKILREINFKDLLKKQFYNLNL